MRTLCILCQKQPPIKNSHVVPKFVIKRLKNGNPLGTLVHSNDLKQIHQDGWKGDYLCLKCEGLFSVWENWACKNIYDPFLANGDVSTNYDERLGLFAASVCFRYIQYAIDQHSQQPVRAEFWTILENLRESLLNKNFSTIASRLYIQFFKPITTPGSFPPGVNTYFFEAIDGNCFSYHIQSDVTWMTYVKIPGLFFILSGWDLKKVFRPPAIVDSHAINATGVLDSASQSGALLRLVADNIKNGSIGIQTSYSKMSSNRIAKNQAKISALPNKEQYRAHKSFVLDQNLLASWPKETAA
jgi:hypothetical protein